MDRAPIPQRDRMQAACQRIDALLARFRPARLLVLCPQSLDLGLELPAITRSVTVTGAPRPGGPLCRLEALPFVDGSFDMVVLAGMLADGSEAVLDEAHRVVCGGGQLVIAGAGWFGALRHAPLRPAMSVSALEYRLRRRQFEIRQCEGLRLLGSRRDVSHRWLRFMVPCCEQVVLRGRHRDDKPVVTPLRFRRTRPAGVRTALDSVSREAV